MIPDLGKGRIHLVGICGTAMASLAGMLQERGFTVTGSDQNVYPPMSDMLADLRLEVRSPYGPENVPPEVDLVVVGNAISRGNPELEAVLDRGLPCASQPEVVKEVFLRGQISVVVAGTHGKTTTTALIAWLLARAGRDPSFLVGGMPGNFASSYRLGGGGVFVIEGDEYDTAYFDKGPKFLHYLPQVVVLANVEYDHADIYPDLGAVETAFRRLVNLIPRRGLLVAGSESALALAIAGRALSPVETFGIEAPASWQAGEVQVNRYGSRFAVSRDGKPFGRFHGPFWGKAGLQNVLAALAVGHRLGLDADSLADALASFKGVRQRMEIKGELGGVLLVDDFAHHPTAVRETLAAARLRWPERRIWAAFEPRSFTARSRVFQRELAEALAGADRIVLARVFSSSRLPPEKELSEEELVADLCRRGVKSSFLPDVDQMVRFLAAELRPGDLLLAMSNGSFGGLQQKLLKVLSSSVV